MTIQETPTALEPVIKTVEVPSKPERAFELFTRSIGEWWPLTTHSVFGDEAAGLRLEPRLGGEIVEIGPGGEATPWGTITRWEPGSLLAFSWHPGLDPAESTDVEVRFSPSPRGTLVELVHRGWERRVDGLEKRAQYDNGWVPVLARFAGRASAPEPDPTGRYFVLVHAPGPAWVAGVPFPRQPNVELHQRFMAQLLEEGRLVIGGPFLDEVGGGFVVVRAESEDEARALGGRDPSLEVGLLRLSVRPWLAAMAKLD